MSWKLRIFCGIVIAAIIGTTETTVGQEPQCHVDTKLVYVLQKGEVPTIAAVSPDRTKIALALRKDKERYVWCDGLKNSNSFDLIHSLYFDPKGTHLSYMAERDRRFFVVVDSAEFGPYNTMLYDTVSFSPDGARFAFLAGEKPDPTRENFFAVVDGTKGENYTSVKLVKPTFSPDSKHVVYFATKGNKSIAVLDGREGPEFETTGEGPNFSPNGNMMVYMGARKDTAYLVVNDSLGVGYYDIKDICISSISTRIAYAAKVSSSANIAVFVDGKAVGKYVASQWPTFSPDGKRLAYWASDSLGQMAVIDSVGGEHFKFVSKVEFSHDSRHYYYQVVLDKSFRKQAYVVDGVQLPEMKGALHNTSIFFSDQGNRVAYVYDVDSTEDRVVIDGVEHSGYSWVGKVVFSPDGLHAAYIAQPKKGGIACMYADGKEYKYSGSVGTNIAYSSDSRHVAYYVNTDGGRELYVNHKPVVQFSNSFPMELEFDVDGSLAFFGLRADSLFRVVVSVESAN